MSKNSNRITHSIEKSPNLFRDARLDQIIDDVNELISGKGFCEIAYLGGTPFVDTVEVYETNAKQKLRADVSYSYLGDNPPFVTSIVTNIYDDTTGSNIVATVTKTVAYNANKSVQSVDTVITRP